MRRSTNALIKLFKEKKLRLALAESMTCGLAAHQLSTVIGTSDVLMGSIVCYHPEVKTCLLGVSRKLIEKHSAESAAVTDMLARKLVRLIESDVHAAVTGLASPGSSESKAKPVGTVFFSVIWKGKLHRQRKLFRGTPTTVRKKACNALYEMLIDVVKNSPEKKR